MRKLTAILDKSECLAVGLMSGTSADGVDAALVRISGTGTDTSVTTLAFLMRPYEAELRSRVLTAMDATTPEVASLHYELGGVFADAANAVIDTAGVERHDVDFVASHGQTVYHQPLDIEGGGRATFQIGAGAVIAERVGVPVVYDFRARDVAAGGSGAPLLPYVDYILFRHETKTRIVLNLGGIVNLAIVPAGASLEDVVAFDVGPCNMLLDGLAEVLLSRPRDEGGEVAASGRPHARLVDEILGHPYYAARPPKSTGRELFGERFVASVLAGARRLGLTDRDALASAGRLVGVSVARALETLVPTRFRHPDELIVSGGGTNNRAVMAGLTDVFKNAAVVTSREYGMHPDAKEAIAFAILGNETLHGRPSNMPGVTGASHHVVLGSICPGRVEPAP